MSKYKIGQGVFIANAMISVRQKEDRWIIDDEDVRIFQKACEKVFADKEVYFEVGSWTYGNIEKYLADYIVPIGKDGIPNVTASYYALLPWRSLDELREHFRTNYPLDSMFGYFEDEITGLLPDRESLELKTLNECYSSFLDNLTNQTSRELVKTQNKANVLQKRIDSISAVNSRLNNRNRG